MEDSEANMEEGLSAGEQAAAGIFGTILIVLVIVGLLYLLRWWMQGPKITSKAKLDGKVVAITGCNTGIGKTTALDMARRGAKVVMLCRDTEKAEKVAEEIREEIKGARSEEHTSELQVTIRSRMPSSA